jgi:pimeloyl-ACP methyl ester carboxylesterase
MKLPKAVRVALKVVALVLGIGCIFVAGGIGGGLLARSQVRQYHTDVDRIVTPHGVDEAEYVTVGGVRQWITVRGMDRRQPILLYLHGGPGAAISDRSYTFQKSWEDYFTVVQWDQRGFGRSALDREKLQPVTKDQLVADAIELIELLRRRYNQPKIVLVGQSFGTVLGASVARARPDLLYAYVGLGQVTGWRSLFIEGRDTMMANARSSGNAALLQRLEKIGPPPSGGAEAFMPWTNEVQAVAFEQGHFWYNARSQLDVMKRVLVWQMYSPSLTLGQVFEPFLGNEGAPKFDVDSVMDWDFRKDLGVEFQVPMIFVSGAHDLITPVESARQLESELRAPYKSMTVLEHSAHVVLLEEPGRLLEALVREALPFATAGPT